MPTYLCCIGNGCIIVYPLTTTFTCTKMYIVDDERRNHIYFGSRGQRSRSNLALCLQNLVGTFFKSLFKMTCQFLIMRGGVLLSLGHGVKGQIWLSVYKTFWARYRLQFLSDSFQTSHINCGWHEEEPYFGPWGQRSRSTLALYRTLWAEYIL